MDISRLYHTLRHLKAEQWLYRGWYKLKKKLYTSPANINIPVQQAIVFGHKDLYIYTGRNVTIPIATLLLSWISVTSSGGKLIGNLKAMENYGLTTLITSTG